MLKRGHKHFVFNIGLSNTFSSKWSFFFLLFLGLAKMLLSVISTTLSGLLALVFYFPLCPMHSIAWSTFFSLCRIIIYYNLLCHLYVFFGLFFFFFFLPWLTVFKQVVSFSFFLWLSPSFTFSSSSSFSETTLQLLRIKGKLHNLKCNAKRKTQLYLPDTERRSRRREEGRTASLVDNMWALRWA